MEALGGRLARHCSSGCSILLQGPLGAGKTTLVRGFLRALGFAGTVKSPTYTLVQVYDGAPPIWHLDLYRLRKPEEALDLGFDEALGEVERT